MARPKATIPTYSLHKPTGQACVYIDRQRRYLGKFRSLEFRKRYAEILDSLATGEPEPTATTAPQMFPPLTNQLSAGAPGFCVTSVTCVMPPEISRGICVIRACASCVMAQPGCVIKRELRHRDPGPSRADDTDSHLVAPAACENDAGDAHDEIAGWP